MFDLIIRGGEIVDGSGNERCRADVAIQGDRIVDVGELASSASRRVLDAQGLVVTPGFIDAHTHMDAQIAWDPLGESSCFHGVTTALMGNCGFTLAPARPSERHLVVRNLERAEDIAAEAMEAGLDWSWQTFPEYLDFVERTPKGINYGCHVGHSALRTWAMGERAFEEASGETDLESMRQQLDDAMEAGAFGLTTSISPSHETSDNRPVASRLATWDEISLLVATMGRHGQRAFELAHHPDIRSTDPEVVERYTQWLASLSTEAGAMVTFGLLAFGTDDHSSRSIIQLLERINESGGTAWGQVHTRQFGILISFQTQLPFDHLPSWRSLRARPLGEQLAELRNPAVRRSLIEAAETGETRRAIGAEARPPEWDQIFILDQPLPPFRSVQAVAAERGASPLATFIDLAVEADLNLFFMQAAAMSPPSTMPATDPARYRFLSSMMISLIA